MSNENRKENISYHVGGNLPPKHSYYGSRNRIGGNGNY